VLGVVGVLSTLGQLSLALIDLLSAAANLAGDAVWFAGGRKPEE
jgi:membrane protein DedA with SNARE-associated domain